ncbi:MAG: hypothetical protein LBC83_08480 [Oscillospiraceae bacterium]|jgi:hypothetical protein|nr:hypothetical protein [Oscillospiraceae bacterium]
METNCTLPVSALDAAALESAFREAMRLTPELGNEAPLREQLHLLMGVLTARKDLKCDARLQSMLLACRLRLRRLLHGCAAAADAADCGFYACDLQELCEDICTAADLLLSALGRSVIFLPGSTQTEAVCAPRELRWLLLEGICNAFCHTHGQEIRVILDAPPAKNAVLLRIESEGWLDLPLLHTAAAREGAGTNAMLQIARLHGGSLLWHRAGENVRCALRLPVSQSGANAQSGEPTQPHLRLLTVQAPPQMQEQPDFVQLLCDKLSPVYTALAPCIGTAEG